MLAELAAANAAFAIIKQTLSNGKELADCGKAVSDFVFAKDVLHKKGTKKKNSVWQPSQDLEEFIALEQINKKEEQLKELMIYYGRPGLWQDWIKFQADARKARQREREAAIKRREELIEMVGIGLLSIGAIAAIIWLGVIIYMSVE